MKHLIPFQLFESKMHQKVIGYIPQFGHRVFKTEPIENLYKYKKKRRLSVYYYKGLKCVNYEKCGKEGEIIAHGYDKRGKVHIDICTKDFYPMTVDHILPRSRGGDNTLLNLQPMCYRCNISKGNKYTGGGSGTLRDPENVQWLQDKKNREKKRKHLKSGSKRYDIQVGDIVYKQRSNEYLGKVVDIRPNPYHPKKKLAVQIEERDPNSLYTLDSLYKMV